MGKCEVLKAKVISRKSYTLPEHQMKVWVCMDKQTKKKNKKKAREPVHYDMINLGGSKPQRDWEEK